VVFGEKPYAEFFGDMQDLILRDEEGLNLLRRYRDAGIPTVAVLITGRPLWMNREIDAADAFVVAWLPGSEGKGVADVLVSSDADFDFTGRLSFAWPSGCTVGSRPMMPRGAGLSLSDNVGPLKLAQDCAELNRGAGDVLALFDRGLGRGVEVSARAGDAVADLPGLRGSAGGQAVTVRGYDVFAQEDGRMITWKAPGSVSFAFADAGQLPPDAALEIVYSTDDRPTGKVSLNAGGTSIDFTSSLVLAQGKGPRTARIALSCFGKGDLDNLSLRASGAATMVIAKLQLVRGPAAGTCAGPF
jgi:beta-glucosidase